MKMNEKEALAWASRTSGQLKITDQEFFRHGDAFLDNNPLIKKQIEDSLNITVPNQIFDYKKSKTKISYYNRRLKTPPLNDAIRKSLNSFSPEMKYEVMFEEGVFYDSLKTGGFDFGLFDVEYNTINFWNYCYGRRPIYNGSIRWEKEINKNRRTDWKLAAQSLGLDPSILKIGHNQNRKKNKPTVIGEIQFGNWGLVYRDILKTIKIEHAEDIDLLIYITATGNLATYISASTVNFSSSKTIFEEFKNVLSVPIWLIGIDFT